eukprot:766051-Hanusia_phi.AAC.3
MEFLEATGEHGTSATRGGDGGGRSRKDETKNTQLCTYSHSRLVALETNVQYQYKPGGKSTAIVSGGRKKVHTAWEDGFEQVEEYDLTTDQLLLRKIRQEAPAGREAKWVIEVGEANEANTPASSDQPVMVRKDTKENFQWRVRNIPYALEVYQITVDESTNQIVVRTSNKKWFKRISIPDMDRMHLKLTQGNVSFTHANRTLVISYAKPESILEAEAVRRRERATMKCGNEGDVDCKQQ